MIKGVIFDLDGVILDSMSIWEKLGKRYLRKCGIEAEPDLARVIECMTMQQSASYMIGHYKLNKSVTEVTEGFHELLLEFYKEEVPLKEGVKECLLFLEKNNIPCLIATSSETQEAEAALKRLRIRNQFQDIVTCQELHTDKTKPEIYLEAARRLSLIKEEILVVEDSFHAVRTAVNAGFHVCAVYDRYNAHHEKETKELAEYYIESLKEISMRKDIIVKTKRWDKNE